MERSEYEKHPGPSNTYISGMYYRSQPFLVNLGHNHISEDHSIGIEMLDNTPEIAYHSIVCGFTLPTCDRGGEMVSTGSIWTGAASRASGGLVKLPET